MWRFREGKHWGRGTHSSLGQVGGKKKKKEGMEAMDSGRKRRNIREKGVT